MMKESLTHSAPLGRDTTPQLPLWLKIAYSAFLAVLVPVYWWHYGPTNFLYFCDVALFLAAWALWRESRLAASMAAVGILIPQLFWCLDFGYQWVRSLGGAETGGMTGYMFDSARPLYLRGLSLFHGWLPFLLLFLVARLGYDGRALKWWTGIAWGLCLVSYFLLPPAGAVLDDPNLPRNINYVQGLNDAKPQTLLPPPLYLILWMAALLILIYVPTHWFLKRRYGNRAALA